MSLNHLPLKHLPRLPSPSAGRWLLASFACCFAFYAALAKASPPPADVSSVAAGPKASPQPGTDQALNAAQAWAEQGKTSAALAATQQALAATPNAVPWLLLQAGLWMQVGRERDAREQLQSLSLSYPELAEAENNLAVLMARQGVWDAALRHLQSAQVAHPSCPLIWRNLSRVHWVLSQQAQAAADRLMSTRPAPRSHSDAQNLEWAYRLCV